MTIIRVVHGEENPYFLMARAAAQDKNLSYEARGMLAYLLSKPDDWRVVVEDLSTHSCGRDQCRRIIKELIIAGYIVRRDVFVGNLKNGYEYEVRETAFQATEIQATENPTLHNTEYTEEREKISAKPSFAIKDRQPNISRGEMKVYDRVDSSSSSRIGANDPDMTELGGAVLEIMKRLDSKASSLTKSQLDQLKESVFHMGIAYPSPEDEYSNPGKYAYFEAFLNSVHNMPYIKKMQEKGSVTAGMVIKAVRGYHFAGGWFQHMPAGLYKVEEDAYSATDWEKTLYGIEDEE